jgi:hypothetical protein
MTAPNNNIPTDNQNEKIIDPLKNEVTSLKFQLTKRMTESPVWTSC